MPHSPSTTKSTVQETARTGVQGLKIERHFTEAGVDPFSTVEWEIRSAEVGGFKQEGVEFPATWSVGQHLADVAVHAWDLATATRQSTKLDPEVARVALDWARGALKPEYRGQTFGPEVEIPENAPIYERLAGFFGRNPF